MTNDGAGHEEGVVLAVWRAVIDGVDVSYAQGNPDWAAAKASGKVGFVYSRACYGDLAYDDDGDVFNRNHDECRSLNIPFGAYCFFLFGRDPVAQAQHFLTVTRDRLGTLVPMVDVEEGSGSSGSASQNADRLSVFNNAVARGCGSQPIIYTNADTWATTMGSTDGFAGHRLWVANYTGVPGQYALPAGFNAAAVHQYADNGDIPGIEGDVDLDVCLADTLAAITR